MGLVFIGNGIATQAQVSGSLTSKNPSYFGDQNGAMYGFYHIEHATHGNVLTGVSSWLSSKEAATGIIFVCTALSDDPTGCSEVAGVVTQGAQSYYNVAVGEEPQDIGPGLIPPKGYDLCQVIIDLYSITGGSTFNATILNLDDKNTKDSNGDLAGPFYVATLVVVPKDKFKGEFARAKFSIQFVPIGDRVKDKCLPVGLHMLLAKGQNINYDVPQRHLSLP